MFNWTARARAAVSARWFVVLTIAAAAGVARAAERDDLASFKAVQEKTLALADRLVAATVSIVPSEDPGDLAEKGEGSGVIVSADGVILTAAHVTKGMGEQVTVILSDGRRAKATVKGSMGPSDAGVLKIDDAGDWPHAEMGDSKSVKVGDWCLATGHANGYQRDRSAPLRLGRVLHVGDGVHMINGIRTDATIIFGDSGGPLFDLQGRVIGINSNTTGDVQENNHVPIEVFRRNWDALLNGSPETKRRRRGKQPGFAVIERNVPAESLARFQRLASLMQAKLAAGDEQLKQMLKGSDDLMKLKPAQVATLVERWDVELDAPPAEDAPAPKANNRLVMKLLNMASRSEELWDAIVDLDDSHSRVQGDVLAALKAVSAPASAYTVTIERKGKPAALGTVVDRRGYILTKASESRGEIAVRIGEKRTPAEVVATREADDLALLKIDAGELTPAPLADADPARGTWVITANPAGESLAMGIVSVPTRAIPKRPIDLSVEPDRAVLGIVGDRKTDAPKLRFVSDKGPAHNAGLKPGDVVTAVDGEAVDSFADLAGLIGKRRPGDTVRIDYKRDGKAGEARVTLGSADQLPADDDERQINQVSGGKKARSVRRSDFTSAFTHDSPIHARDCGGPVLDLEGRVVAVNIARVDRTASYAIPAPVVKRIVAEMMPK